jgi:hypothetical protein
MKRHATVMTLGVLLALAATAPSFAASAQSSRNAVHHAKAADPYAGYYNSAVPEGNYTGYAPTYSNYGGAFNSGAMGGVGR